MNRPSRRKLAAFTFPALAVALMLSGCVSSPAADDDSSQTAESASPQADPSPSESTADDDTGDSDGNDGNTQNSGETTPPPVQPQPPAQTPTQSPVATPSPSPSVKTPTINVISQRCVSGRLTLTMTANYDSSYRKGIRSIVVERPNEYNALIDADASWLGPETGQGNQWTVQPAGSRQQRFKDTLHITVSADGGAKKIIDTAITANC